MTTTTLRATSNPMWCDMRENGRVDSKRDLTVYRKVYETKVIVSDAVTAS